MDNHDIIEIEHVFTYSVVESLFYNSWTASGFEIITSFEQKAECPTVKHDLFEIYLVLYKK